MKSMSLIGPKDVPETERWFEPPPRRPDTKLICGANRTRATIQSYEGAQKVLNGLGMSQL